MSNRVFTDHTEYVGVDTMLIRMPLDENCNDGSSPILKKKGIMRTAVGYPLEWAKGSFSPDDKQTIHFTISNGGRLLEITLHPSKIMDNQNSTLCNGDLVHGTVAWTIKQLFSLCRPPWTINYSTGEELNEPRDWPSDWTDHVTISRLDLARDIYDDKYGFYPGMLQHVEKKNYPNDYLYRNSGKVNTLNYGSGARIRTNFYNKSAAPNHNIPDGWSRFEIQVRRPFLAEVGINTLSDISHAKVEAILWDRWEDGRLGTPISVESALSEFFENIASKESPSTAITMLGLATAMEHGLDVPLNARTISHYKKTARTYGFNLGQPISTMGTKLIAADFASGRVIEIDTSVAA